LTPLELDLGRGVTLILPTAVFARGDGATLPITHVSEVRAGLPEPTSWTGIAEDRAARLGAASLAWAAPQHFYPYFDVIQADWAAELPKALISAALGRDERDLLATLRRLNAALQDSHGRVDGPGSPEFAPSVALVILRGRLWVRACREIDPPIPSGSELLEVDGEKVARVLAQLRPERSAATQAWMDTRLQREVLQGPQGTAVRVTYLTPSGQRMQATLIRTTPTATLRWLDLPAAVAELQPGIWYLDLDRLDDETFSRWLQQAEPMKSIIFDLRGYPRLSPKLLQHLARKPFLGVPADVPVVTLPDRREWSWDGSGRLSLDPLSPRLKGKLIFLAGGSSASCAESCLATVREYGLGQILGEPTAGTNGRTVSLALPCGFTMNFTGMRVRNYDGTRFHGVGVQPNRVIRSTLRGLKEGRDELLQQAVESLHKSGSSYSGCVKLAEESVNHHLLLQLRGPE
jgi:hypothetical protein